MIKNIWCCSDTSWECENCAARKYCSWFEEERRQEDAEKALENMRKVAQNER